MASYHLTVKICGRGRGIGGSDQSPIAAAAYQSGEKLYNEKDGEYKNYGRKERIVTQGLILADNFPPDWGREKLWSEVEKSEKNKNAQLYRKWEMALPQELSQEQNIKLAKDFIKKYFVNEGMCADWAIHYDSKNQNP
ncbi:MAG: MobA/MobL family protein, partial [Selenomonadaceae bacterium]|nr:MobA/MobL family protein [Selenomonadaceae bacterium]